MNRTIYITVGIIIIILVFLVWLFLFFNGAPKTTNDVFSDLGIVEGMERPAEIIGAEDPRTTLNLSDGALQQITTNPVAGYGTASTSGGWNVLRFVERGTGYIFEINLTSGMQTQVSPTTIPHTTESYFSTDLNSVVIVTEHSQRTVLLLELPDNPNDQVAQTTLPSQAENIQFISTSTVTYTINSPLKTVGWSYDTNTKEQIEQFVLPIPDATTITIQSETVYAYPKPTSLLEGALYELVDGEVEPVSKLAYGLVPFVSDNLITINQLSEQRPNKTYSVPNNTPQPIIMLPEKCAASPVTGRAWCAAPAEVTDTEYVEDWYKGVINSNDILWEVENATTSTAYVLSVPETDAGRTIDAINLTTDPTYKHLLFINKVDSTLWLFKLPQ